MEHELPVLAGGVNRRMPEGKDDSMAIGIEFKNILRALDICGDTSVLEALYPWLENTPEGKEILERKKAEADEQQEVVKTKEEVVIKVDKRTARVIKSIMGHVSSIGRGGPREATYKVYMQLDNLGITSYNNIRHNDAVSFPDSWEKCED